MRQVKHLIILLLSIQLGTSTDLNQLIGNVKEEQAEVQSYDGWFNNIGNSELGSAGQNILRLVQANYSDGVYQLAGDDFPNPLLISKLLMNQHNQEKEFHDRKSKTGKNVLLLFYGQHVFEEIVNTDTPSCPPEYMYIPIPEDDEYRNKPGHTKMPFIRSRYDHYTGTSPNSPRMQINQVTPWLDAGFLYGTSKGITDKLRAFKNGKLKVGKHGLLPPKNDIGLPMSNPPPPSVGKILPVERLFKVGNPKGNETPFLLSMYIIWLRWHNAIAESIHKANPHWPDERIFNEARKWVIATQQHITVNEWLPTLINQSLPEYTVSSGILLDPNSGYDSSINPGISALFQSAANQFLYTLMPSVIFKRDDMPSCNYEPIRLCNSFWEPYKYFKEDKKDSVKEIILGMISQAAEEEDSMVVDDLRRSLYGPLEFSRRDGVAIELQKGRDHGLPDYLETRRQLGLSHNFKNIEELAEIWPIALNDPMVMEGLKSLYNDTLKIDVGVGGLLETKDGFPGKLFTSLILNQMLRLRNADRFWFENQKNGLFSNDQIQRIKLLKFYDIISTVTSLNSSIIPIQTFEVPNKNDVKPCMADYEHYNCSEDICYSIPDLPFSDIENCSASETYDYFSDSETGYILTFLFLGIFVLGCIGILFALSKKRNIYRKEQLKQFNRKRSRKLPENVILATEWLGGKSRNKRQISLKFDQPKKAISISLISGNVVRSIDMSRVSTIEIQVSHGRHDTYLLIRIAREYDLVLKFNSVVDRNQMISQLEDFIGKIGIGRQRREVTVNNLLACAVTKEHRQKELEQFFRVVFAQAFSINHDEQEMLQMNTDQAKQIINTELTKYEFAEALSMKANSTFVNQMFSLVDKDENGYISFREFLDMITIFAKGSADEKIKLMFDMYDIDRTGQMTRQDFLNMIRSMLELSNQSLKNEEIQQVINSMFTSAGLQEKQSITLQDFMKLVADHKEQLGYAQLNFKVSGVEIPKDQSGNKKKSAMSRARQTIIRALSNPIQYEEEKDQEKRLSNATTQLKVETKSEKYISDPLRKRLHGIVRFVENYKKHIFWITIYTQIVLCIFLERMYYYAFKTENSGLRKIAGYGVAVTRGSAAAMMFTFSTILLTMCRNIITRVRETFLQRFIPFDAAIPFHKYIACIAIIFTVIHVIGHAINFYSISTQPPDDLACLFRNVNYPSDKLPTFVDWCFTTITGITGVFLVMVLSVIYVFAMQYSRRNVFNAFWLTHNMYPVLYILIVLHGSGDLIQPPIFYLFFIGPCIIFTIDRLVSVSRKKIEISVVKAELLPSDVTHIEFKRPLNFEYKSGQWVRIACPVLNSNEYHPFTLSSAPHEENLSLHIRAVGPWTRNLRMTYDPDTLKKHAYPKIYLDGPYGEGHQDWYRYDVAVLVGGGIGVTPFASILKDIVFKASIKAKFQCQKVYFIWVTRTEKHFEWLTDIIREVENNDKANMVSVHIFITQFYQKFDLRTTMLYICERHFQKISNRSLFTGLKSITHFGRPNFESFLDSLQLEHPDVTNIGVFSCGPPLMTGGVETACESLNKRDLGAVFAHHYENF